MRIWPQPGNTSQPCFPRSHSAMHVQRSTAFLAAVLLMSVALLLALLSDGVRLGHAAETFFPARVAVYFSPSGGATDAVVHEVNSAKQQLLVQAYSFTSAPIAKALNQSTGDSYTQCHGHTDIAR